MLIEVVDEQPVAPDAASSNDSNGNVEDATLEHLVTHYAQPIHIPSDLPYFATPSRGEEKDGTQTHPENAVTQMLPSAVTKYCLAQLQQQATAQHNDQVVVDSYLSNSIRKLLHLYPTRIRPAVFDDMGNLQATGVAVLYHFEWLLTLLLQGQQQDGASHSRAPNMFANITGGNVCL